MSRNQYLHDSWNNATGVSQVISPISASRNTYSGKPIASSMPISNTPTATSLTPIAVTSPVTQPATQPTSTPISTAVPVATPVAMSPNLTPPPATSTNTTTTIITPIPVVSAPISAVTPVVGGSGVILGGGGGGGASSKAPSDEKTAVATQPSFLKRNWLPLLLLGAGIYVLVKKPLN